MSLTTKSRYSLAENSLKICEDLVSELMRQDDAWPFLKPVTKKEVIVLCLKCIEHIFAGIIALSKFIILDKNI